MAALTPRTIRIGTWNVREARIADDEPHADFASCAAYLINRERLDILALQEVDFDDSDQSTVLRALRSDTRLVHIRKVRLSRSSFNPDHGAGLAIASSFPMDGHRGTLLPNPELAIDTDSGVMQSYNKGVLECLIRLDNRQLSIMCLHSFPFQRFQRDAGEEAFTHVWTALGARLSHNMDTPLIVAGDFNSSDRSLVLDRTEITLKGAMEGRPTHGELSVDDILYSNDFSARSAHAVTSLSDHALCVVELALA